MGKLQIEWTKEPKRNKTCISRHKLDPTMEM